MPNGNSLGKKAIDFRAKATGKRGGIEQLID